MKLRVGERVNYSGHISDGEPRKNCVIEDIDDTNKMFNQPMAIITDVEHWVSLNELTRVELIPELYDKIIEWFLVDTRDNVGLCSCCGDPYRIKETAKEKADDFLNVTGLSEFVRPLQEEP